jgi:UPF0271 protein
VEQESNKKMQRIQIDLNCDMGEWTTAPASVGGGAGAVPEGGDRTGAGANSLSAGLQASDRAIMPWISSASIACGGHAGDAVSIQQTVSLAIRCGVGIGAHPGYPDPGGFGRQVMAMTPAALRASLLEQIRAVQSAAAARGAPLRHVKPHGALYNQAASDPVLASLVAGVVHEAGPKLVLFGLPGSCLEQAAKEAGLAFACEVFADRGYRDDGSLVPRGLPGALLHDTKEMIERVLVMATEGWVKSVTGRRVPVRTDTVCIHGDNPAAPGFVRALAARLQQAGIRVRPFGDGNEGMVPDAGTQTPGS